MHLGTYWDTDSMHKDWTIPSQTESNTEEERGHGESASEILTIRLLKQDLHNDNTELMC